MARNPFECLLMRWDLWYQWIHLSQSPAAMMNKIEMPWEKNLYWFSAVMRNENSAPAAVQDQAIPQNIYIVGWDARTKWYPLKWINSMFMIWLIHKETFPNDSIPFSPVSLSPAQGEMDSPSTFLYETSGVQKAGLPPQIIKRCQAGNSAEWILGTLSSSKTFRVVSM